MSALASLPAPDADAGTDGATTAPRSAAPGAPPRPTPSWRAALLVLTLAAMLGWLSALTVLNWPTLSRLWLEASEQKFLAMSGRSGPATWLVVHHDFAALERAALSLDDVLGVEIHRLPHEAAIAFADADSAAVARVAALPMVERMERRRIPMICH